MNWNPFAKETRLIRSCEFRTRYREYNSWNPSSEKLWSPVPEYDDICFDTWQDRYPYGILLKDLMRGRSI